MRAVRFIVYPIVAVLLLTQVALAATATYIKHTDHQILIIIGGSMEPLYHVGDAVVLDTDVSHLAVGDVVTFHSGDTLTTHRIVAKKTIKGEKYLQTKGDANATPDPDLTPEGAVIGKPVYHVVHGGVVNNFLTSRTGRLVTYGPALLLLLALELTQAVRSWKNDEQEPTPGPEDEDDTGDGEDGADGADATVGRAPAGPARRGGAHRA